MYMYAEMIDYRQGTNMNDNFTELKSRRSLLKKAAMYIAGVAVLPLLASFHSARAAEKLQKADVKYQDKPKDGKDCDDCMRFVAGATPKAKPARSTPTNHEPRFVMIASLRCLYKPRKAFSNNRA